MASTAKGNLFNLALVVLGGVVLVLLYAFITRSFSQPADAARVENPAGLVGTIIQVEVRNSCGVSGLAASMTHYLRRQGFDVVEVGDDVTFDRVRSVVVDRVGDRAAAEKVAQALGLAPDRIVEDIQPDYFLDVSVLIGKDYQKLKPFSEDQPLTL